MTACIVGWHHSKFGKLDGKDAEDLIVEVAVGAIRDAGIEPKDVDAIYLPGGYPELHAGTLAAAQRFRSGKVDAHQRGTSNNGH